MKSFIGSGTGSVKDAVASAISGLSNPTMVFYVAPYEALPEVASLIYEKFPTIDSFGSIGTKLYNGKYDDTSVSVFAFFDDAKVKCGLIENSDKCPVAAVAKIERQLKDIAPGNLDTTCIEVCTGYEEVLTSVFTSCLAPKGVSLCGGTTFGVPDGKEAYIAYNGKVYYNACAYAIVKNTTGKVRTYKVNIFKRGNWPAHYATKVDTVNRTIIELDGKPVADVYSDEVGVSRDKIIENVMQNPMGRVVGDETYIASMKSLMPDGSIELFKRVNTNDCIYFLEQDDYKKVEGDTRNKITGENKSVSFVFSVDCVYRYIFYSNVNYMDTYVRDMASLGNHFGIVGGGEQFNNQHVNQTMSCVVFE